MTAPPRLEQPTHLQQPIRLPDTWYFDTMVCGRPQRYRLKPDDVWVTFAPDGTPYAAPTRHGRWRYLRYICDAV